MHFDCDKGRTCLSGAGHTLMVHCHPARRNLSFLPSKASWYRIARFAPLRSTSSTRRDKYSALTEGAINFIVLGLLTIKCHRETKYVGRKGAVNDFRAAVKRLKGM